MLDRPPFQPSGGSSEEVLAKHHFGGSLLKKKLVALGFTAAMVVGMATPALAGPPGPGDKQCVPGQNAQPQPGKKTGTCPGR